MANIAAPIQLRSIGGIYKVAVQSDHEYKCVNNWLYSVITARVGHERVYDRWPLDTISIDPGDEWITYVYDHSDPDKYTHGGGPTRTKVTVLYFEVLAWKQGTNYEGIEDTAALLMDTLDVATTVTADGTINGAERYQFMAGQLTWKGS